MLEHNELGSEPESAVLFERLRTCSDAGKEGTGGWRLLLSKCNSTSDLKDEMDEGIDVDKPFDDRSLEELRLAE